MYKAGIYIALIRVSLEPKCQNVEVVKQVIGSEVMAVWSDVLRIV